jgi:hypothetical protein
MSKTLFETPKLRDSKGRFATRKQALHDKTTQENIRLRFQVEMLTRKLMVYEKLAASRKLIV